MNLAYIVSAYKLPDQLARLITRLSTETTHFFVHIDRKTDEAVYRRMTTALAQVANVHFLERHRSDWGGFGHVRATLKGIGALVRTDPGFDYAILLTGQDYPLRSNAEIHDFFLEHAGRSFIQHFPLPSDGWAGGGLDRIETWHLRVRGRRVRIRPHPRLGLERRFPAGLRPFGGSAYWNLTRACTEYVHEFVRCHGAYTRFFRLVDVPDEIFFQTIVLNSPFREEVVDDDLRYLRWKDPETAGGPAVLGREDYDDLLRSEKLFARKFDAGLDAAILDLLDARIDAAG